ncbi:Cenp-O kinetochore centromere component-domain-containing protein [Cercophora scortea]|uniref:Cenp-O kinetochore centromere component-domain-containing protein n=1 Tax=Cercophora scortea TaxID=314031 RepID=A0AAE0J2I1_9PEZI|nr:Cenp-O kinetochore centromere component-domain-containing protein [Cercophora scortea]
MSSSSTAPNLDDEIENLQARVSVLKKQLRIQTSTLIASPSTRQLFTPPPTTSDAANPVRQKLLTHAVSQQAHNQQCLYRTCAGLTTFRVQDPDPNAVDGGAVLGLRIEVFSRTKFLRPYYVLLNRPYGPAPSSSSSSSGSNRRRNHLRLHRHTVPPCIPLAGLAARHLPPPGSDERKQGLPRFARALRREIVRYHHRLGVVADLRKAAGLEGEGERLPGQTLVDITPADAEAKQLSIEWADGRTGRLVMGDDGEILKLVALGDEGRDHEAARELLGGAVRVDEVVKSLLAAAKG